MTLDEQISIGQQFPHHRRHGGFDFTPTRCGACAFESVATIGSNNICTIKIGIDLLQGSQEAGDTAYPQSDFRLSIQIGGSIGKGR